MAGGIGAKETAMNANNAVIGLVLSACVGLSPLCTGPMQTSGNSSQTPNAVIGWLYEPDGKTPARAVQVFIRPRNYLADISGTDIPIGPADTASVLTDSAGRFAFDTSLNAGLYAVEAARAGNAVFIDSVTVVKNGGTDSLPLDTLQPFGAIRGTVRLSAGGDPSEAYVLAFGVDRFTQVNTDGSFLFTSLAHGMYDVRLISTLQEYATLDRRGVAVVSSDTTDLGTIDLPYTGIPVPQIVSLSYDPVTLIVTIRWNRLDTAKVKSYNIYRYQIGASTEVDPLNQKLVVDTVYSDTMSSCLAGCNFGYQVAAVDDHETCGRKSAEARLEVVGADNKIDIKAGSLVPK
jgi:hypothetical protein